MVNEAALLFSEGVAHRAGDIDVVLVNGYGFPSWVGGPVHWARSQPRSSLEQELDQLTAASGFGVALVRHKLGAAWFDSGRLLTLSERPLVSPHAHYMCWSPGALERWECAAFVDWLQGVLP